MTEFLLELYVAKTNGAATAVAAERLSRAAAELTAEGSPVRLVRSIFVPEDETCFLLVEAATAENVRETARRAALPCERVVHMAVDIEHRQLTLEGRTEMTTIDVEDLKRTHRATWAAGDYAAVAEAITDEVAPTLLGRVGIDVGQHVLDVATGTGNVALRASAAGARVTALDLTPELFDTARRRARELGVDVEWVEGDAEELPFEAGSFDRVLSAFGVQFAPRHDVAARELVRVCRPGGAIGLVNWTPEGAIGELFRIVGRYMPPPPSYAIAPPHWGNEQHVRELFRDTGVEPELERTTTPLAFESAENFVSFMETYYGPTLKARERLTAEGSWDDCRREIVEMMNRRNEATDGGLLVPAEYLIVVARRM